MNSLKIIDQALLDQVSAEAAASPRLRKNYNFHEGNDAVCHRLLNAIEPGSYVPPHRHLDPNKAELMVVLRGRLGLVFFNELGEVTGKADLAAGGAALGADIPVGTFHSVLALASGTVFLETKAGPYRALDAAEKAPWAPAEGEPATAGYFAGLRALF